MFRATVEETINFIIRDFDDAISEDKLADQSDKTRATEAAVLSLKSRVLLYAASELHHNSVTWAPGYAHPELISYTGGDRAALIPGCQRCGRGSNGYEQIQSL